jgi:hypothetical protein
VVIALNPTEPWMATAIGVELAETVEQTTQVTLTSLCESCLADTAAMPIELFQNCNQEDPTWKQHLEAMSDSKGPHFHASMAVLAEYAQHMFNLQDNTVRTVTQQRFHLGSLEQHAEELSYENVILCSGTLPPSD